MEKAVFKIKKNEFKFKPTTNFTLNLSKENMEPFNRIVYEERINRTALANQMIAFAIKHMGRDSG